ncbi:MAG: alpha/beta superfamily hydrolase [Crocinitomicaceae bacterium]|jgi:alpha/beta superfamily hydrolase
MKNALLILVLVSVSFGCKKVVLDGLAFPGTKLEAYEFENFSGEVEIPQAMLADAANYTLVEMNSTDQATGEVYKIYGLYIGDIATISSDTVLLYLHGQSLHMDNYFSRASLLANVGGKYNYGVFMFDYRGYGMSEGNSSEAGLSEDTDAAIDWLISQGADANKTMYYGYSLGAIPGIERAAYRTDFKPAKLMIESPLASVQHLVNGSTVINVQAEFVTDLKFENSENIKDVDAPLLWLHGKADTYVSIDNGELIYANYGGTKSTAIRVEGSDHSEVPAKLGFEVYLGHLLNFIRD